MLNNKNIVIGISGGIACYKIPSLISMLKREGANVDVIMTKNAQEFITPLTISSIAKSRVITDMFKQPDQYDIEHISLAQKADLFVIAPATGNIIGKVANGIADDMLTTTIMATKAKVIFAPAMNNIMYFNQIVQNNISRLKEYGYIFIEPQEGYLACNTYAIGKLADIKEIFEFIKKEFER